MTPLVIAHGNCHDGLTAAAICRLRWPGCDVLWGTHGEPFDVEVCRGRDVVFVDFTLPLVTMLQIADIATTLVVLDHHETARDALADLVGRPNVSVTFDMTRSGAGLAWDTFFPMTQRRRLVDAVEDHDLWRFALPDTKAIQAALNTYPMTLEARANLLNTPISELVARGQGVLAYIEKLIAGALPKAEIKRVGSWDVPTLACPCVELVSELGNRLAVGHPFAAIYSDCAGVRTVSLRSVPGGLNVAKLAAVYGGGGHAHAAGFRWAAGPWVQPTYRFPTIEVVIGDIPIAP